MKVGDKVRIVRSPLRSTPMQSSSIIGKIGTIEKIHVFAMNTLDDNAAQWHEIIVDEAHITIREDELKCINYTNMYDELEAALDG
jgi:hypothetical protein|tara:strand:- start:203 stop:457 length:255 start_codon:yes stop_codon:yes gene_type:complete